MRNSRVATILVCFVGGLTFAQDDSFERYRAHVAAAEAYLDLDLVVEAKEHLSLAPKEHRQFEWRYLNARADESVQTIEAHAGPVWAVAAQPNGPLFATASADSTVKLWSFPDGKLVATLIGHTGQVMALDFSPDGSFLATGAADKSVRIWDIPSGRLRRTINDGLSQRVYGVRFSPTGDGLTVTSWELNRQLRRVQGFVNLYKPGDGSLVRRYDVTDHPEASTDFLPDGRTFISGGWGFTLRQYATDSSAMVRDFQWGVLGDDSPIQSVDVSPAGRRIAVASKDDRIRVFDVETGERVFASHPSAGHRDDVNGIAFGPDGRSVASAASDGLVIIWDAETGQRLKTLRGHTASLNGLAWSADGRSIVSACADGSLKLWNSSTSETGAFDVCESGPWLAAVSRDGAYLVAPCSDEGIGIWEVKTGRRSALLPGVAANAAAFSSDGAFVLTGGHDRMVRYWSVGKQAEVFAMAGHTSGVFCVDIHPTEPLGVSGSSDGTLRLWDLRTGQQVRVIDSTASGWNAVRFSPDGRHIAAGIEKGDVRVWDVQSGTLQVSRPIGEPVRNLMYNGDGSRLAATGGRGIVVVWDTEIMQSPRVLRGHTNMTFGVAFSADGKRLATSSYDRTVRLWDLEHDVTVLTMRGSPKEFYNAAFVEGGKALLLTRTDGVVRVVR